MKDTRHYHFYQTSCLLHLTTSHQANCPIESHNERPLWISCILCSIILIQTHAIHSISTWTAPQAGGPEIGLSVDRAGCVRVQTETITRGLVVPHSSVLLRNACSAVVQSCKMRQSLPISWCEHRRRVTKGSSSPKVARRAALIVRNLGCRSADQGSLPLSLIDPILIRRSSAL